MSSIVNIAAYKYFSFDSLAERRKALQVLTRDLELRGTILLSSEGINMFVAGARDALNSFLQFIRTSHPELASLAVKESLTDYQPFQRMVVKIKQQIVPVGDQGKLEVNTPQGTIEVPKIENASPKLPPRELKKWLDEGRPVALLDTRNDYETDLGTFQGAIDLRLKTFREFPDAAANLPDEVKKNPVVMFCTGGIRCEKIGPYMKGLGFENIYQLEGGILKYFEDCEQAHYDGDCFVFDQRVSLDPKLAPSDAFECFACRHILTAEETKSNKYVPAKSCPYCYIDPETTRLERQAKIREVAQRQLGSVPYENRRWVSIPQRVADKALLDALDEAMPGYGRENWKSDIENGNLLAAKNGFNKASVNDIVPEGARYLHILPGYTEPRVSAAVDLIYEDDSVIVVNKGAPLPVHPSGRFNRNTLLSILGEALFPDKPRPCHRLDMNTTGLVVFARRYKLAGGLQQQFAESTVEKVYRVEVEGSPSWDAEICQLAISKEKLPNGGRLISEDGQACETKFRVLERHSNSTLIEAILVTGRTHQIRLHCAALGHPVVNDPLYLVGGASREQPDEHRLKSPMALHCCRIALKHPATGERVEWNAPEPPTAPPSDSDSTL